MKSSRRVKSVKKQRNVKRSRVSRKTSKSKVSKRKNGKTNRRKKTRKTKTRKNMKVMKGGEKWYDDYYNKSESFTTAPKGLPANVLPNEINAINKELKKYDNGLQPIIDNENNNYIITTTADSMKANFEDLPHIQEILKNNSDIRIHIGNIIYKYLRDDKYKTLKKGTYKPLYDIMKTILMVLDINIQRIITLPIRPNRSK